MKSLNLVAIVLPLLALMSPVRAEFNYDYVQAHYTYLEMDTTNIFLEPLHLVANGYGIDFSFDYENNFMLVASFEQYKFDEIDGFDASQDRFTLGAGYHYSFNDFYDAFGTLSYVGIETDNTNGSFTDDGFELVAGLRIRPLDQVEIAGSLKYSDYADQVEQTLSEYSMTGQGRWYISESLSVGLGASFGENTNTYFGDFRVQFNSLPFGL